MKKLKYIILSVVTVSIIAIIISFVFHINYLTIFNINTSPQATESLKIGADFTLSGSLSYWSTELKKGLDLAVEKSNRETGKTVNVIYEDNKFTANEAVSIFQKFATVDKVNAVISCFTPMGQPLRSFAAKFKIPLIATVTSADEFATVNDWTFRDFPTQNQQASALAKYVYKEMNLKKGSYLVVNDDYGLDGARIFNEVFTGLGGTFSKGEYFTQDELTMRNQIIKVLKDHPDFLLVIGRDRALATVCKQIREVNPNVKIVGVNAFDASIVWELSGAAGEGIVFTSAPVDYKQSYLAEDFKKEYTKKYNEDPNYVSVYGYTIGTYLCDILNKVGDDNDAVRKALSRLEVNSIRGVLHMNEKRDVLSSIGIFERKNNKSILVGKY